MDGPCVRNTVEILQKQWQFSLNILTNAAGNNSSCKLTQSVRSSPNGASLSSSTHILISADRLWISKPILSYSLAVQWLVCPSDRYTRVPWHDRRQICLKIGTITLLDGGPKECGNNSGGVSQSGRLWKKTRKLAWFGHSGKATCFTYITWYLTWCGCTTGSSPVHLPVGRSFLIRQP